MPQLSQKVYRAVSSKPNPQPRCRWTNEKRETRWQRTHTPGGVELLDGAGQPQHAGVDQRLPVVRELLPGLVVHAVGQHDHWGPGGSVGPPPLPSQSPPPMPMPFRIQLQSTSTSLRVIHRRVDSVYERGEDLVSPPSGYCPHRALTLWITRFGVVPKQHLHSVCCTACSCVIAWQMLHFKLEQLQHATDALRVGPCRTNFNKAQKITLKYFIIIIIINF